MAAGGDKRASGPSGLGELQHYQVVHPRVVIRRDLSTSSAPVYIVEAGTALEGRRIVVANEPWLALAPQTLKQLGIQRPAYVLMDGSSLGFGILVKNVEESFRFQAQPRIASLGETCLIAAIRQGNARLAEKLLAGRADANARDSLGETALMEAASAGAVELCTLLVKHGADPTARSPAGRVARDFAAGHPKLAPLFEALGFWREDRLLEAAEQHDEPRVEDLLRGWETGGLDLARATGDGQTVLHQCSVRLPRSPDSACRVVRLLVQARAVVNAENLLGETPLALATRACAKAPAWGPRLEVPKALLDCGAEPNSSDNLRETSLMEAASIGDIGLVALLLRARASPARASANGMVALDFATDEEVRSLLRNPASVQAPAASAVGEATALAAASAATPSAAAATAPAPAPKAPPGPAAAPLAKSVAAPAAEPHDPTIASAPAAQRPGFGFVFRAFAPESGGGSAAPQAARVQAERERLPGPPLRSRLGLRARGSAPPVQSEARAAPAAGRPADAEAKAKASRAAAAAAVPKAAGSRSSPAAPAAPRARGGGPCGAGTPGGAGAGASPPPPSEADAAFEQRLAEVLKTYDSFESAGGVVPPEARFQRWTKQELDVFIGSLGTLWPIGRPHQRPPGSGASEARGAKGAGYPGASAAGTGYRSRAPRPRSGRCVPPPSVLRPHCQILGLDDKVADPREVRLAYHRLALVCHPDKNPGDTAAAEKFHALKAAHDFLMDALGSPP